MAGIRFAGLALFAALLPAGPVLADGQGSPWSAGVMVSTLGPGLQVSYHAYEWAVLRVEGTYISVPAGGLTASLQSAGAIFDLHPFKNAFRVSGGMRYFEYNASGDTVVNGDNGASKLHVSVENTNKYAPYLGIGMDTSHFSGDKYEFRFGLDVGAVYSGKPNVSITSATASEEEIQSQVRDFVNKYQIFNFYPVVGVSARINF
jgi:hypothetical protein